MAGEVEAVGPAVTHIDTGQRIYGYARKGYVRDGTWAEYVAVPARGVAAMPWSVASPRRRACRSLA